MYHTCFVSTATGTSLDSHKVMVLDDDFAYVLFVLSLCNEVESSATATSPLYQIPNPMNSKSMCIYREAVLNSESL